VRNDGGEQLLTNQYETVTLTSRDVAPSEAQQLDASRIANKFETVKDVSPSLFSSLNDQMAQEQDLGESNTSETTNEVKEEAVEEEIKAEEEVVEETVAEEQLLEEQQPEAETLEDSIEQIETLDTMPEMKTIEMSVDAKNSSALRPKAKLLKQLRESLGEDQNIEDVQFISQLEFDISLNGELREANNANAFSTGAPISIGSITLQEGGNALYEIFSDPTGFFTIDSVTGELFFNGTHMRDFENDGGFNLGIKATDQSTGRILAKDIRIGVADVDESPDVRIALEDVYSVGILALASDDQGIVARDVMGARIAKLAINDPEGETYTAADFSIVSASLGGQPANTFFQVVEDNGDFYLELKPGFMVTGANNIINDGTSDITTPLGTMFNITVSLDGTNQSIDLRSGEGYW